MLTEWKRWWRRRFVKPCRVHRWVPRVPPREWPGMFALHVYDQECKVCGVERGYVIYMGDRGDQAT